MSSTSEYSTGNRDRPGNIPATGAPTIGGTARVGETLSADTSGIADENGLDRVQFSYQWVSGEAAAASDIAGATASSYTLADADAGKTINVQVSFTDRGGYAESLTSAATETVAARPNTAATGAPGITGTARVGETLTADTSGIADADGLDHATFIYQWLADGADINGTTGSTYTLADADEGKAISVKVSFSDDRGNEETLTSADTAAVEAVVVEAEPAEPPPAPTNPTAVVNADGSVTLAWGTPDDDSVSGYRILRRRPSEGEKALLVYVDDTGSTATSYTDNDVTAGIQHVYRVKAVNAAGAGEQSNYVNVTPEERRQPAQNAPATGAPGITGTPTNLTAVVNADGSVTLTWDAPDDDSVTGYLILRRRPYEGEKTLLVYVENTGSTATTFTDADVTAGTQHVYRVKAVNEAGAGEQSNYVNVDP